MYSINISVNLYTLDELSDRARNRAIREHRDFLLSVMSPNDFISGDSEYDTPEKLNEAYESEYDYYLMNDEPIIESIEINEYLFFCDGEIANVTHYCGKHPLSGKTVLHYLGKDYEIA